MISQEEFEKLKEEAFSGKGYRPNVKESPDGDGVFDVAKRYAHIAPKYGMASNLSYRIREELVVRAEELVKALNIPARFSPRYAGDSTLRVLEYPPGATSAPHTDFCLFTLQLYRDQDCFRYLGGDCPQLQRARETEPGVHFGELLTEIMGWPATKHEVIACTETQNSAVFFVMPPLGESLSLTAGEWLEERYARSRG